MVTISSLYMNLHSNTSNVRNMVKLFLLFRTCSACRVTFDKHMFELACQLIQYFERKSGLDLAKYGSNIFSNF